MRVDGIGEETAKILQGWQDHTDPAVEIREAQERGISIVTQEDEDYPAPLRDAYDPPLLLYVWGKIEPRDKHAHRRGRLTPGDALWHPGDQEAFLSTRAVRVHHRLRTSPGASTRRRTRRRIAASGRTIAVIGSGLARLYPPENLALAEKIAAGNGAVVSEFPLHTAPDKQTFPMRNRIVAAWSRALLVVECPAWSGSLITANLASEYGKPIFAVPGPIDKPTLGRLQPAHPRRRHAGRRCQPHPDDLGELPFARKASAEEPAAESLRTAGRGKAAVFAAVTDDESPVDRIIERCGLPAHVVSGTLMKLEMRRLVRAFPGFRYARR